jgi:hypothetical protein
MNEEINDYWIKKSKKYNLELKAVKQRHIGTDNAKKLVREFREYLKNNGAVFHLKTNVDEIKHVVSKDGDFELETDKGIFSSKYLIVSPGRHGSMWFKKQSDKLGIESKFNPVDIGLRIEMPLLVYGDITKDIYDPKFIYTNRENGDKVRTFCTNAGGSVRLEPSKELNEKNIINGDAKANEKTDKVNMAILHTVSLTDPIVDTMEFGKRMAEHALWLGGGKPICQRVGDFMNNRRSKVETFSSNGIYNRLKSSLKIPKHAYPGDINHVYSYRTMKNIKQFLKTMDSVFPGFLGSENILYAPEIKFYSYDYPTNDNLETAIENLFVAGDGCGKSRGIVGAGLSGILAAEGIIKKK